MKIRNNSRILALVLALVMILPLISIPVFAGEEEVAAPLFSENFDGKALDDVLAGKPSSAVITAAADAAAHGDVLQISVTPQGLTEYYIWTDKNNKWPIKDAVITDGKISGTTDKGEVVDAPLPENPEDIAKTTTVGGTDYKVVFGSYADSQGGAGNVATPAKFKNPTIAIADHSVITIEMDLFLPEGMKNSTGVSGRLNGTKVSDGKVQNIELFELTADGTKATIKSHENSSIAKGEATAIALGGWVNLIFEVDFVNNHVSVLVNEAFAFRSANLNKTWNEITGVNENSLQVQIDRGSNPSANLGDVQFDNVSIISGTSGISYNPNAIKPLIVDFESLEVGAAPSSIPGIASIAVANSNIADTYGSKAWKIDFERVGGTNVLNIDKNPMIKNPAASYDALDKVVYEVDYFFEPDAKGQIQNQIHGSTALIGGTSSGTVNFVDIYQIAFGNGTATLKFESSGIDGQHAKTYSFSTGKWVTVSAVIDLDTGLYDIYVDGNLAIGGVQLYKGGYLTNISIAANKMIIGGKVNKVDGKGSFQLDNIKFYSGDKPSVEPVDTKIENFDAFKYGVGKPAGGLSMPALATYKALDESNIVINLPLTGLRSADKYALLRADGKKAYAWGITIDEEDPTLIHVPDIAGNPNGEEMFNIRKDDVYYGFEDLYYAWYEWDGEFELNDFNIFEEEHANAYDRYYLVPEVVAEIAIGSGGQIGMASKVYHKAFSYADTETVVLSADYFIEKGSKGIIEAQFESYKYDTTETVEVEGVETPVTTTNNGSWIQLYYFDAATGQFEGLDEYMDIDAWNNVKVFMNLKTGVCDIYLNDAWVKTEEVGHENLIIGQNAATSFSFAKIQRTTSHDGGVEGNLMIDNVGVYADVPATEEVIDGYLTQEAYLNNLDKLLITVTDPAFRMESPNGIRFATKFDAALKAQALALLGEGAILDMGTLIAPLDYVEMAGAFTKEALDAIEVETVKYMDLKAGKFFTGAVGVDFGEGETFTASIVDIKPENMMRDFAAIGYITVKVADGDIRTYYARSYAVANAVYEAKDALAETERSDWTEEQLALLDAISELDPEGLIVGIPESPMGNSKNPVLVWSDAAELVVEERIFFGGFWNGMNLKITGPEGFKAIIGGETVESVGGVITVDNIVCGFFEPFTFGLLEAGTYTVETSYPAGSLFNPIVLESLEALNVDIAEGGAVYYLWTADKTGVLAVNGTTEIGSFVIENGTKGFYGDPIDGIASGYVYVEAGDEVLIMVSTIAPESDDPMVEPLPNPAGKAALTFAIDDSKVALEPVIGGDGTGTLTFNAPAGAPVIYSAYGLGGKQLTIENAFGVVIVYNGEKYVADWETYKLTVVFEGTPRDEITFAVVWNIAEPATVTAALTIPAEELPEGDAVVIGDNVLSIANGWAGTNVVFTAPEDATYVIALGANTMVGYDDSAYFSGESFEITLTAGQVVALYVSTENYESGDVVVSIAKKAVIADGEVEGGLTEATLNFTVHASTGSFGSAGVAQSMLVGAAGSYTITVDNVPTDVWVQIYNPATDNWSRIDNALPYSVEAAAGDSIQIRLYSKTTDEAIVGTALAVSIAKA